MPTEVKPFGYVPPEGHCKSDRHQADQAYRDTLIDYGQQKLYTCPDCGKVTARAARKKPARR